MSILVDKQVQRKRRRISLQTEEQKKQQAADQLAEETVASLGEGGSWNCDCLLVFLIALCLASVKGSPVTVNFGKHYNYWWTGSFFCCVNDTGYTPMPRQSGERSENP